MRFFIAALVCLASALPARAQLLSLVDVDRVNRRLAGQLIDYTHNHGRDNRIFSPILGMPRDLYVYLPPGYTPARAYPLILYFHMAYIDEHIMLGWIAELDRMILRGEVPPAVVACPDGTHFGRNRFNERHSLYINGCGGRFEDHVLQEVLPFLMHCYSIRPEREAHALLGTSAGGYGAMSLAIRRRDFFGAVTTLAGPVNLRYSNCHGKYREDFDPATYRWKTRYNPNEVIGVFYLGLSRVRARKYMDPVFACTGAVERQIMASNPADVLFTTDLQPGELAIYVNYPGRDNWNFDAQAESFIWLAGLKGIPVDVECAPCMGHSLRYFRTNHPRAFLWLGQHLLPPVDLAPDSCNGLGPGPVGEDR